MSAVRQSADMNMSKLPAQILRPAMHFFLMQVALLHSHINAASLASWSSEHFYDQAAHSSKLQTKHHVEEEDCRRKMDNMSPFPPTVQNKARTCGIRPLPSCAVDVIGARLWTVVTRQWNHCIQFLPMHLHLVLKHQITTLTQTDEKNKHFNKYQIDKNYLKWLSRTRERSRCFGFSFGELCSPSFS